MHNVETEAAISVAAVRLAVERRVVIKVGPCTAYVILHRAGRRAYGFLAFCASL